MIHSILHFSILFSDNSIYRGVSCGQGVLIMELHPPTDLVDCWGMESTTTGLVDGGAVNITYPLVKIIYIEQRRFIQHF